MVTESRNATEEELLQEIVDEMKDCLEDDLKARRLSQRAEDEDEDFDVKYPKFKKRVDDKANLFKRSSHGYRRICCVPSFALGLVMASRMQTHFTHAPWFKFTNLVGMIDVYGTVSE